MAHQVAFFVCGTPSNNEGFQFVELGPEPLPGAPRSYLESPPDDAAETYRFQSIAIAEGRYLKFARILRIHPNDAGATRGAYVAVGCLVGAPLSLDAVASCVDVVSEIYGNVCGLLDGRRSFPQGFSLAEYAWSGAPLAERLAQRCSPLVLSDLLLQGLNLEGPIDWQRTKHVSLAPAALPDAERYRLYTKQGGLGATLSMDRHRAEVDDLVRQTVEATSLADRLQDEWLSLRTAIQGGLDRLIEQGSRFGEFSSEIERIAERSRTLEMTAPTTVRDPRPEPGELEASRDDARASQPYLGANLRHSPAVRRVARTQTRRGSGGARGRWSGFFNARYGTAALIGIGAFAAVAIVLVLLAIGALEEPSELAARDPASTNARGVTTSVLPEETPPATPEGAAEHPASDIAKERAALDELTNR
jgi:hypothetical protein